MSVPKMMPGSEPYTPEEWAKASALIGWAADQDVIEGCEDLVGMDPYARAIEEDRRNDARKARGG